MACVRPRADWRPRNFAIRGIPAERWLHCPRGRQQPWRIAGCELWPNCCLCAILSATWCVGLTGAADAAKRSSTRLSSVTCCMERLLSVAERSTEARKRRTNRDCMRCVESSNSSIEDSYWGINASKNPDLGRSERPKSEPTPRIHSIVPLRQTP